MSGYPATRLPRFLALRPVQECGEGRLSRTEPRRDLGHALRPELTSSTMWGTQPRSRRSDGCILQEFGASIRLNLSRTWWPIGLRLAAVGELRSWVTSTGLLICADGLAVVVVVCGAALLAVQHS